ncbi:zinc c2h2 type family protein [Stylonychia lemnae]|uniref:Zinc c2h2 type family protein n=1 Tax=Stylonychia lemnae TaxID=5949 RepID=A0A078A849_STYLE|nr:zinc c2h2 type family protein [Stylonychia lemnae]|eukprot:CDW78394.1 zinc c2h2 type family protein [Stylonychia lemnae]
MKNTSTSTVKCPDQQPLQQLAKLLGKRLRSKILINNIPPQQAQDEQKENQKPGLNKRLRIRKDQQQSQQSNTTTQQQLRETATVTSAINHKLGAPVTGENISSLSGSTLLDELQRDSMMNGGKDEDFNDTQSLTASDFEVLNKENFFDRINDAFTFTSQIKNLNNNDNKPTISKNTRSSQQTARQRKEDSKVQAVAQLSNLTAISSYMSQSHKALNETSYQSSQNDLTAQALVKNSAFSLQFEVDQVTGLPKIPAYEKTLNYMDEYWNVYLQNQALLAQIDKIATERNDLLHKSFKIQNFYDENLDRFQSERYSSGRKKHNRRCANDIERQYKCPYPKCEKFYGSEGSLNLHIKIKHNGGNKTDREKIAKSIVFAQANGINLPENFDLNLPPGSVEKAATQVGVSLDSESIKKLEQDLTAKNELTAKMMKEQEMLKNHMQYQKSNNMSMSQTIYPPSMIKSFGEKPNQGQGQSNSNNDENSFKMPTPVNKLHKNHSSNSENNPNILPQNGKSSIIQPYKPLNQSPRVAFGENTNSIHQHSNLVHLADHNSSIYSQENKMFDKNDMKRINNQNQYNQNSKHQSSPYTNQSPLKNSNFNNYGNTMNNNAASISNTRQSKRF